MSVLTVNVGSSSVRLVAFDERQRRLAEQHESDRPADPVSFLRAFAQRTGLSPGAVAHRVVHGGERFSAACRIDDEVERGIEALNELAPLHNPPALAWIRAARAAFPASVHVAVFDTAFFSQLPALARSYALPADMVQRYGLYRYGFHGLAHRYLSQWWERARAPGTGNRVISLQLGSGCSMAAIVDGRPVDTSMGFSPLEGLVMATRSGNVDAGLVLYLQRRTGWSAEQLEHWLNARCGLLGLSGSSADARELEASSEPAAQFALQLFCYRVRHYLGAYLAVLGGADAILFGGGVGEHAPRLRAKMLEGFAWAGIELDAERNAAAVSGEQCIAAHSSRVDVRVVSVDESVILAEEARQLLEH